MIDFHSHFLPRMDDGSKSTEESYAMLSESAAQGVTLMVATPHFYARHEEPQSFLERRSKAVSKLELTENFPKILLGAEVAYFRGISHCDELAGLNIEGTKLLLLEMPFEAWSSGIIEDVCAMEKLTGFTPVLAHLERYLKLEGFERGMEKMRSCGVLVQSNAENFLGGFRCKKAMKSLLAGEIDFLGSDCHNTGSRAPNMAVARDKIAKHCGEKFLEEFENKEFLRLGAAL